MAGNKVSIFRNRRWARSNRYLTVCFLPYLEPVWLNLIFTYLLIGLGGGLSAFGRHWPCGSKGATAIPQALAWLLPRGRTGKSARKISYDVKRSFRPGNKDHTWLVRKSEVFVCGRNCTYSYVFCIFPDVRPDVRASPALIRETRQIFILNNKIRQKIPPAGLNLTKNNRRQVSKIFPYSGKYQNSTQ